MKFFSWFRRASDGAREVALPSPNPASELPPPEWSANQIPSLLQVARRLVEAPRVQALEEAFDKGDGDSLRRELAALLDRATRVRGPEHADTATVLEQLGRCGRDPAETAQHLEPCLAIRTRTLGPAHSDSVRVQHFLGFCYQNLQQYDRAIPLLERSLEAIDAAGQGSYYWLPQVLGSLGISYRHTQQFEKAERTYLRCLKMAEDRAGKNPANLATALINLGTLYTQLGRHDQAEACLSRGADLLPGNPGLPWEPVAHTLHALAAALAGAGQAERAEGVYLRCARLCMQQGTIPPARPWPSSGGLLATALQVAGCPEEVRRQVAANEDLMMAHLLKGLGRAGSPGEGGDPPHKPAEPGPAADRPRD
jgi:tetratricopeptide (TPR) repeat protein